jgi:hypothetical protein
MGSVRLAEREEARTGTAPRSASVAADGIGEAKATGEAGKVRVSDKDGEELGDGVWVVVERARGVMDVEEAAAADTAAPLAPVVADESVIEVAVEKEVEAEGNRIC